MTKPGDLLALLKRRNEHTLLKISYERKARVASTPSLRQANERGAEAMKKCIQAVDEKLAAARAGRAWGPSRRRGGVAWR